jgi:hypothetical protein
MLCVAVLAASCLKNDDQALWDAINAQNDRIAALEEWQQQINADITSLQALVATVRNRDYVTSIEAFNTGNGGYTVSFASGKILTINNGDKGDKGEAGSTPIISVRMDTDGNYYWTLDGEFIVANGLKLPVTGEKGNKGENGTDGITPLLRIDAATNYWEISYDEGKSWASLGVKATGKDGTTGKSGDSLFKEITEDENNVYFTLTDDAVITIRKNTPLGISFEAEDSVVIPANSTRYIRYTVTSVADTVQVEVVSSADLTAKVILDDTSGLTGAIEVTTGNAVTEYSKVIILVSDGSKVIMRAIYFEQAGLRITDNSLKSVPVEGGYVTIEFLTNVPYNVVIPEDAESWISLAPQTRTLKQQTVTLRIEPNGGVARYAAVKIQSTDGILTVEYIIEQGVGPYQTHYMYEDLILGKYTKADYIKTWNYYAVNVSGGSASRQYLGQVVISEITADDTGGVDYLNISGLSTIPTNAEYDDTVPIRWSSDAGIFHAGAGHYLGYLDDYHITDRASAEEGGYYKRDDVIIGGFIREGFIALVPNPAYSADSGLTFTGLNFTGFTEYDPAKGVFGGDDKWINRYKWLLLVDPDLSK